MDKTQERALRNRPDGWVAPGPSPRGDNGEADLVPLPDEDLSYLSGDFRIFQKKAGHRWSLDDSLVAYFALCESYAMPRVSRALDLGCGIGSVLLMVSWGLPETRVDGIEAQEISFGLAGRSIRYNGVSNRVRIQNADLRSSDLFEEGVYDLVTGTPPYLPLGTGVLSEKVQKAPCLFETRGGIEDYCKAGARYLAANGRFVVCAGAIEPDRTELAAKAAGLRLHKRIDVIPKAGKTPLLGVYVFAKTDAELVSRTSFLVRNEDDSVTRDMILVRERLGFPPLRKKETR